jgi:M6 family metalloprotease-like protein
MRIACNFYVRLIARTAVVAAAVVLTTAAHAAYLQNVPITLKQPDGTVIRCLASGDEFYNWAHDDRGYVIIQDHSTGYYAYATLASGDVVPSSHVVGAVDPKTVGLAPSIRPTAEKLQRRIAALAPSPTGERVAAAPRTGTLNNIAVFVRFSDQPEYPDPVSDYEDLFNDAVSGENSMVNYYLESSYNALIVPTTFYPIPPGATVISYWDSQPRDYYAPYDQFTNPIGYRDSTERRTREHALLAGAVNLARLQIPGGLNVDGDGDNLVDHVCFVIQGEPGGWAQLLWPHYGQLSTQTVYINGLRVWGYNLVLSAGLTTNILCHEMTHSLGAPDLYRWSGQPSSFFPVGPWDVMCNDYLATPQFTCAYMKYRYMTWISGLPQITASGTYTLNPLTSPTGNCYKIPSPNSTTEFFVVEYRRRTGTFESSLPGSGLLVYRINTREWGNGFYPPPPARDDDEVYVYRPGGTPTNTGDLNSAYFSSDVGRTAINDFTNPFSFLSDGSPGGLNISNITSAGDTISFYVAFPTRVAAALIDVDVRNTPVGVVTSLPNNGTLGGTFESEGGTTRVQGAGNVKAIVFTGNNWMRSSFDTPTELTSPPAYTVSAWVLNESIANEECYLSWSHRGGPGGSNCQMNYGSNGSYGAVSHWDWRDMGWGAAGAPAAGVWRHLAVTYDGTTENVYADGVLRESETKWVDLYGGFPVYLGCALEGNLTSTGVRFSGALASVRVYNVALDAAAIAQLAQDRPLAYLSPGLSGYVRDPGGNGIYNACVQVGGYLGPAAITDANGRYVIPNSPSGQVELYVDALGYAPYIAVGILPQTPGTVDITLTPRTETGVIVNGDFELVGAGGPGTAAGWEWWIEDEGGLDGLGNPWPPANPDMYLGFRETANNQTPGGTANGFTNTGVPHPDPGVLGINWEPPGACAALTSTTMTDDAAAWTVDAYSGWVLEMVSSSNPDLRRSYTVASNTATTITIESGDMLADGFVPGDTYNMGEYYYKYWYSCYMRQLIAVDPASKYNFYFKANWDHNQNYDDVIGIWAFRWESEPGVQINGWVDPRDWNVWYDSPGWRQYLDGWFISGNLDRGPMLRMTPPLGARYIEVIFGYWSWTLDPNLIGRMLIDDVVVDRVAPVSVGEAKQQSNGVRVTTTAICTLAPRVETSPWFYMEDASRASGICVYGLTPSYDVRIGDVVTVTGDLLTDYGERVIVLTEPPTVVGSAQIAPVGVNTRALRNDPLLVGLLVAVAGRIIEIAPDGSYFTISDGSTSGGAQVPATVRIYGIGGYKVTTFFQPGVFVRVTGVVSRLGESESVILYRDVENIVTPFFATGFEPGEGYVLGPIDGQQGWSVGSNPKGVGVEGSTVSNEAVNSGTQALKLDIQDKWAEPWWNTGFTLLSPTPIMPDKPLRSLIVEFWILRDAMLIEENEFFWYPREPYRYTDYGNDAATSFVHALVWNTTPRTYGDPGWPEIGGRWVPVRIEDDYVGKTRTVYYDGSIVALGLPLPGWADRAGTGFNIFYNSRNWGSPRPSAPTYIDDIRITLPAPPPPPPPNWEE